MRSLEDRGEVGYSVAEHRITKNEAGTSFTIEPLESVVFALDPVKPRKKKAKVCVQCVRQTGPITYEYTVCEAKTSEQHLQYPCRLPAL